MKPELWHRGAGIFSLAAASTVALAGFGFSAQAGIPGGYTHGASVDATQLTVFGVKLGMTPAETIEALKRKFPGVQLTIGREAAIAHSGTRINGIDLHPVGYEMTIYFAEVSPDDGPIPVVLTTLEVNVVANYRTTEDGNKFVDAAIEKYGAPSSTAYNDVSYEASWCFLKTNHGGDVDTILCDRGAPYFDVSGGVGGMDHHDIVLRDPRYANSATHYQMKHRYIPKPQF